MPRTRKKIIKTVYKDEDDSEAEKAAGDFSDSGSEAEIPEESSSDEDVEADPSSADEFDEKPNKRTSNKISAVPKKRKTKFAKDFINKINRQSSAGNEIDVAPALFSVKDLTDEDKLLPSVLNLSESDSSDDESATVPEKKQTSATIITQQSQLSDSETEAPSEYKDVWAQNIKDSEEVAKKTFMELEQHKNKVEETKASILNYVSMQPIQTVESDVKDLLALGEETPPKETSLKKVKKAKKARDDSDSDMEDWEEVNEAKTIPQQGIQLIVDFPDAAVRKKKKIDVEMMMKRKINKVKKEYQVYMHKVHVLSWLGHGNYVSRVLNDQEVLAAALSLVPSKECYPCERVDMNYIEQITTWYKDKLTLKQDKNEDKFRPKAPPLKEILESQIKSRTVTAKKYLVFIFVSMLRAIGLQCRIMFNFVTLPIKPPSTELCSLSTKPKDEKKPSSKEKEDKTQVKSDKKKNEKTINSNTKTSMKKIPQVDGNYDSSSSSEMEVDSILQLDGNDDVKAQKTRSTRTKKNVKEPVNENDDVSPPKRARKEIVETTTNKPEIKEEAKTDEPLKRKRVTRNNQKASGSTTANKKENVSKPPQKKLSHKTNNNETKSVPKSEESKVDSETALLSSRRTRNNKKIEHSTSNNDKSDNQKSITPKIIVTNGNNVSSKYFENQKQSTTKRLSLNKTRSETANPPVNTEKEKKNLVEGKTRTKSAPRSSSETSKYFNNSEGKAREFKTAQGTKLTKKEELIEDKKRVSHRDLLAKNKTSPKMDVKCDLVDIIKKRVREAKEDSKKGKVKAKVKQESGEDSDYLPEEETKQQDSESDEDFKPTKISPRPSTSRTKVSSKPSTSRKVDRRVLSSDTEEGPKNRIDVWCEVFVEELEQWIPVDVVRAKVHCTKELYQSATHPVCYIVGWDNNNYLKDLTHRYVPHWNTVTRKQRAEPLWWETAIKPWTGPSTARDREENDQLNRMQLEAPLPTSIAEYKNHPLYALKRHLLKFEAIYPPDAAVLGFVRKEPVYARECVYVCRSRDTWLKEAKVVRLGENPYKVVKARPKWDKLSNKLITDKPLEVFGPWQVADYEPPVAECGVVPRNAYGNVELFKECMLPIGTVHIKLPGLNRVAKKLNIDCAPAMTGFDFNGGWSHPVYDGFVVCKEFEEIITEAWLKDQEEQERREREKIELRVYGNWKRLIKGLFIKERLKNKYGFEDPAPPPEKKKRAPKYVAKKT